MTGEDEDTLVASVVAAETAEKEAAEGTKEEAADEKPETGDEGAEAEKEDVEDSGINVDDGDDSGLDEPVKATKKSASDTIRTLKAERNAERLEREKLISELAATKAIQEERARQEASSRSAAEKRAEEDRLALLDPAERNAYHAHQKSAALEHRLNLMQMQMQDNTDRAVFQSQATHDPLIEKYKDQVEDMLNADRQKGYHASREEYLNFIVGRAVRAESAKTLAKKRESASKRIDTVTSKPASARGDVAGSKKGKSEEDRLRGVLI